DKEILQDVPPAELNGAALSQSTRSRYNNSDAPSIVLRRRAGELNPHAVEMHDELIKSESGDFQTTTASRQAEQAAARGHQARQTRARDGTWNGDVNCVVGVT